MKILALSGLAALIAVPLVANAGPAAPASESAEASPVRRRAPVESIDRDQDDRSRSEIGLAMLDAEGELEELQMQLDALERHRESSLARRQERRGLLEELHELERRGIELCMEAEEEIHDLARRQAELEEESDEDDAAFELEILDLEREQRRAEGRMELRLLEIEAQRRAVELDLERLEEDGAFEEARMELLLAIESEARALELEADRFEFDPEEEFEDEEGDDGVGEWLEDHERRIERLEEEREERDELLR